jgi:hypothetical protein
MFERVLPITFPNASEGLMLDQCGDNNNGKFFPFSARSEQSNEDGRDAEVGGEDGGVVDEGVGAIFGEEETAMKAAML